MGQEQTGSAKAGKIILPDGLDVLVVPPAAVFEVSATPTVALKLPAMRGNSSEPFQLCGNGKFLLGFNE
jgi:hypothetical protein